MNPFPPLQRLPLRPGALEAVVAEGRRRRRRIAAGGGAGLALASIAVAAAGLGGAPLSSVGIVEPARSGEPTTISGTPAPATGGPVDSPSPAPGGEGSAAPSPSAGRPSGLIRSVVPVPLPTHDREPSPPPPERSAGEWHEPMSSEVRPITSYCGGASSHPGWCHATQILGDEYGVLTVTWHACRATRGSSPATLRFPTEQEADIVVSGPGGPLWTWSYGRTFAADPHEVTVNPGFCQVWETTWNSTDDAGEPLPAGTYTIGFEARSDGEPVTHSIQYELT